MQSDDVSTTASLVASSDVNGTEVYSHEGQHVGTIDHLMIDKESGTVAYAVMSFGGFLGLGEHHHSIPWKALHYDVAKDGFVTHITPDQLKQAPERPDNWQRDRQYQTQVYQHFGVPPYWF